MAHETINSENLSKELLKKLFDDAFIKTSMDDKTNSLYVEENGWGAYVEHSESKQEIIFTAYTTPNENVQMDKRLEFINRTNIEWKALRACVLDNGRVVFDYYLIVHDGLSPKSIIMTYKRFISLVGQVYTNGNGIFH